LKITLRGEYLGRTDKKWKKIEQIIKDTKELNVENIIIVPMEDWNPSVLTKKRQEILKVLKNKRIKSEMELAKVLKRKRPNVVKDLQILEHYGLIKTTRKGNKVVPEKVESMIITY
jgi:predicted transcriptional regulator